MRFLIATLCALCSFDAFAQAAKPPYPHSDAIPQATWDFSTVVPLRKARGSDLWPCTWAADDQLYCAWGDGEGFAENGLAGRVSLGFARIAGTPEAGNIDSIRGADIWGRGPQVESQATFGGKVGAIIAVDGVLYANGSFFTQANSPDPVGGYGPGPLKSMVWSSDQGRTWEMAPWSSTDFLGSFLSFGKDNEGARDEYVYLYYKRGDDLRHVFLKRVPKTALKTDPAAGRYQYFVKARKAGRVVEWSSREHDAKPVFTDANNVDGAEVVYVAPLGRYLLTVGHNPSGDPKKWSVGQVGLFEGPYPWGPWATVDYQEEWGGFGAEGVGDYLGLRFPPKWFSADGRTLWGVFSSLRSLDSFNVVQLTLQTGTGVGAREQSDDCKERRRGNVVRLTCVVRQP